MRINIKILCQTPSVQTITYVKYRKKILVILLLLQSSATQDKLGQALPISQGKLLLRNQGTQISRHLQLNGKAFAFEATVYWFESNKMLREGLDIMFYSAYPLLLPSFAPQCEGRSPAAKQRYARIRVCTAAYGYALRGEGYVKAQLIKALRGVAILIIFQLYIFIIFKIKRLLGFNKIVSHLWR